MKPLRDLGAERRRVLTEIRELARRVALAVGGDIQSLTDGLHVLVAFRKTSHEETNQLLHEALIVEVATQLAQASGHRGIQWMWNPRQTGTALEPDLQGIPDGKVAFSVEATAAHAILDSRIKHTLRKLSEFEGRRIYCVRSPEIRSRALTKVLKAGYDIEVRLMLGMPSADLSP